MMLEVIESRMKNDKKECEGEERRKRMRRKQAILLQVEVWRSQLFSSHHKNNY